MPTALIAPIASLVGGGISAITGMSAANTQAKAAQAAAALAAKNQAASLQAQQQATQANTANQTPFLQAGTGAENQLSQGTQAGGDLIKGYGQTFQAPTGVTEQNDPGYQFRLQQGQKALENSAAARGGLLTGGTAKSLEDYAQGTASNEYGNVYNRALTTFNSGLGQFQTEQANAFNRLAGVAGTGQQAANQLGQMGQAGAQNIANINTGATGAINQQNNAAAYQQAAGVGQLGNIASNVVPGAITGITGILQQNAADNALKQSASQYATSGTIPLSPPGTGGSVYG